MPPKFRPVAKTLALFNFNLFVNFSNQLYLVMSTSMHYGATRETFQIAERLRKNMTSCEKILWERICRNQLGVRIRRQHPIWKFIADFYCHEVKLVIEIDGKIHLISENKEDDISRDTIFKEFKIEILRFTNDVVLNEIDLVIERIKSKIEALRQKQPRNQSFSPKSPEGDFGFR